MKRAILKMSDELVMNFLKQFSCLHNQIISVKNGLPPDVKIVRMGHDGCGTLNIVLESEEIKDTTLGDIYPVIEHIQITGKEIRGDYAS
jgi:hypothetical protein